LEVPEAPVSASFSQDKEIIDISNGFEDMCLDLQKRFLKIQAIFARLRTAAEQCPECAAAVKEFEEVEKGSKFSGSAVEEPSALYDKLSFDGELLTENDNDGEAAEAENSIWASLKKFGLNEVRSFFSKYTTTKTVTVTSRPAPTAAKIPEPRKGL
jgi:hypothetical protein